MEISKNISIQRLITLYGENQIRRQEKGGLPYLGRAIFDMWQSNEVCEAADLYEKYSLSSNLQIEGFDTPKGSKIRLGGGSPAKFPAYKGAIKRVIKLLNNENFSNYPLAAGAEKDRKIVLSYLTKLGIKNNNPYSNSQINESGLSLNNIIFTNSSTQAYTFVLDSIIDYGDVILITSPNYGLFIFNPERLGGKVRLIKLEKQYDWLIHPVMLEKRIAEINLELNNDFYKNKDKYYLRRSEQPPKVIAFLNMNPHNPTGKVYGKDRIQLLKQIGKVCLDKGVFIIDDLVYRELTFDQSNKAVPLSTLPGMFSNTITLFSLSKAFGLAAFRSGMIVADEVIVSLVRDKIFQQTDSLSVIQSAAIAGTFNTNSNSLETYSKKITKEYKIRYNLVKAMCEGLDSIDEVYKNEIKEIIINCSYKRNKEILNGIKNLQIVNKLEPESGFFVILDFTKYKGKSYKGFKIIDDDTLLKFLYTTGNIKLLTGTAFCWPNKEEIVARITFALERKKLINSLYRLKSCLYLLK